MTRVDFQSISGEEEYLINLIDSPGHVDFSSEVSCPSDKSHSNTPIPILPFQYSHSNTPIPILPFPRCPQLYVCVMEHWL